MKDTTPKELTEDEFREIRGLPLIRRLCGQIANN